MSSVPTAAAEADHKVSWRELGLRRVLGYVFPWWRSLVAASVVLTLSSALLLVPAVLVRNITSTLNRRDVHYGHLATLTGIAAGALLIGAVLSAIGAVLVMRAAQGVGSQLRTKLFSRLLTQTAAYHTDRRAGDLISRIMNDAGDIADGLSAALPAVIRGVTMGAASVGVMTVISWQLTLAMLAVLPFVAVGLRVAGRGVYRARRGLQRQKGDVTAFVQEGLGLSGLMLVRAFGRWALMRERFADLNDDLWRHQIRVAKTTQRLSVISQALLTLSPAALIGVGGYLLAHHRLSLGSFLAFGAVSLAGLGPALERLGTGFVVIWGSGALWGRVFEVLDTPSEIVDRPSAITLDHVVGAIELQAVSFTYPGQLRAAVADISFTANPGQLIALVGRSGAGKTTIAALLARMIDPQLGKVLLDGRDVRDISLNSLTGAIGMVFQDAFLFNASVRENLQLAQPNATEADMLAALDAAFLRDVVAQLSAGLDTIVGERGYRLSGGERQRIALARTMLKNPPIVVLDEATSHLDTESEKLVQLALAGLFHGRTSIVIAHRLSTVIAADVIIVLDDGRIVERGTHRELIARGGLYAHLYGLQFVGQQHAVDDEVEPGEANNA